MRTGWGDVTDEELDRCTFEADGPLFPVRPTESRWAAVDAALSQHRDDAPVRWYGPEGDPGPEYWDWSEDLALPVEAP